MVNLSNVGPMEILVLVVVLAIPVALVVGLVLLIVWAVRSASKPRGKSPLTDDETPKL